MNISTLNKAVSTVLSADTRAKNAGNGLLVALAECMTENTLESLTSVRIELYRSKDWKVKGISSFGVEPAPKTIQVYFSTFTQAIKLDLDLASFTEIHALKEAIKEAKKASAPAVATESEAAEPAEPAESQGEGTAAFTENEAVDDGEGGLYNVGLPEGRLVVEALPEWFNDMAHLLLAMNPAEQERIEKAISDSIKTECIVLGLERKKKLVAHKPATTGVAVTH